MNALRGILTRGVTTLITLFGVAVIVFVVIRIAPGDPISMMLPPGASQADIERLRAFYGLDRSIPGQFLIWLSSVLHGDFGTSISLRQNVLSIVLDRLPATLELCALALLILPWIIGNEFYVNMATQVLIYALFALSINMMLGYGGMVSFTVASAADAIRVAERTEVFVLAESLGAVESLIEVPGPMTHASVAGSPLEVPPELIRLSVGLEDPDDLLADLDRALA